jgi:hypothetical protein
MMIKKHTGQAEEFNISKLENSLRWAGVPPTVAHEIAAKIVPREGMTTNELRALVMAELKGKDSAAARRYETTRTRKARIAPDVSKEVARLHPNTMHSLGLGPGERLQLEYAGKKLDVRAEASPQVAWDGVRLHTEALQSLGASVEGKVILHKTT